MISFFIRALKWMFCVGVAVWFVLIPLLPIYGAIRPWPEAKAAIRNHGIQGTLLMIGAGGHQESTNGEVISKTQQRTYLSIPESLITGNFYIFTRSFGTATDAERDEVTVDRLLPILLILWVAAGLFSTWVFLRIQKMRTMRSTEHLPASRSVLGRYAPGTDHATGSGR